MTDNVKNRFIGKTYKGNKVPKITKIIYPWSGIFRDACYALVGSFLLNYAMYSGVLSTDGPTYQAQLSIINIAMIVALIWDGINDPIMGLLVEKFHFKYGKYRPWILIGAIGNAIAVLCMFLIRPGNPSDPNYGWGFVGCMIAFYILWDTFFTMNDIGYWAMLPSLTSDPKERASLTTSVTIATSIGAFLMNIAIFVLPGIFGQARSYGLLAMLFATLFLISQALIFFLVPEKERDLEQEKKSEKTQFLDLFRVVGKNKQLRVVVIALIFYNIGEGLLTGIGVNYFYLQFGAYGQRGGMVSTLLALVFVFATVAAQAFYPMLAKKFSKKTLLTATFIAIIIGYGSLLFLGFPLFGDTPIAYNSGYNDLNAGLDIGSGLSLALGGTMFLDYLFAFIFFAGAGIFYIILLVYLSDAIDYNEYKYNDRKEAVSSAWRPLTVKLSSALQQYGIRFLVFFATGSFLAINAISDVEGDYSVKYAEAAGNETAIKAAENNRLNLLQSIFENESKQANLMLFGILVISIIIICFIFAYWLARYKFKIDENLEQTMANTIASREEANNNENLEMTE